jgi:hypothetical protein
LGIDPCAQPVSRIGADKATDADDQHFIQNESSQYVRCTKSPSSGGCKNKKASTVATVEAISPVTLADEPPASFIA